MHARSVHGLSWRSQEGGVDSRGFESGLLEKGPFKNLEILENPQTVENKGESDHFLEILENLGILEIRETPKTSKDPPFCGLD